MGFDNAVQPVKTGESSHGQHEEEGFDGPIENRECRDVIVLLLFCAFLGGMGYIVFRATTFGNPYRIIYGMDSWGNVCNQDNIAIEGVTPSRTGLNLQNRPYLFYFNNAFFSAIADSSGTEVSSKKICVSACPSTTISTVADLQKNTAHLCVYDIATSVFFDGNSNGLSNCPSLPVEAHEAFLSRCVPTSVAKRVSHVLNAVSSLMDAIDENLLEKSASDLTNTWFEISLLSGLAVLIAVVITLLLQFVAVIIIWLMVWLLALGSLAATGAVWYQYYKEKTSYEDTLTADRTSKMETTVRDWLIGSISVTVVTVILILILLILRKHIKLVVELFKEAGKAITCMPFLLLNPVITLLWLAGTVGGLVYAFLYIETSGTPIVDVTTGFVSYKEDEYSTYLKWYHIFGMIWVIQFVTACHKMTIAGAVAIWYFTRSKSSLSFPIMRSVWRVIRYHLGSLAFGSLIITFVVIARMILSFIENRLRGGTHPVAIFLLKCLQCCLWCFEKFLKFLNTNAYIEIAIHGYGFCKAAREAFHVILSNVVRLAAINSVGDFVLFLGKAATVAIVTVVGIQLFSSRSDVNYVWLPITLVGIFTYFIVSCFMSVYEMTIDTIFICFCEDTEMNDGDVKPYFMSIGLRNCLSSPSSGRVSKISVQPAP